MYVCECCDALYIFISLYLQDFFTTSEELKSTLHFDMLDSLQQFTKTTYVSTAPLAYAYKGSQSRGSELAILDPIKADFNSYSISELTSDIDAVDHNSVEQAMSEWLKKKLTSRNSHKRP